MRLSFDDGPGEDTPEILDLLTRHGLRGVFFAVGERVADRPDVARRIVQDGHVLGNHSWSHADLAALPPDEVRAELERTSAIIEEVAGTRPLLFRPPFGHTTATVDDLAAELGMRPMLWDVDTRDWDAPGPVAIARAIRTAPPRGVILLHDGPAARGETVAGLRLALDTPI